jgi:hypothetical protein
MRKQQQQQQRAASAATAAAAVVAATPTAEGGGSAAASPQQAAATAGGAAAAAGAEEELKEQMSPRAIAYAQFRAKKKAMLEAKAAADALAAANAPPIPGLEATHFVDKAWSKVEDGAAPRVKLIKEEESEEEDVDLLGLSLGLASPKKQRAPVPTRARMKLVEWELRKPVEKKRRRRRKKKPVVVRAKRTAGGKYIKPEPVVRPRPPSPDYRQPKPPVEQSPLAPPTSVDLLSKLEYQAVAKDYEYGRKLKLSFSPYHKHRARQSGEFDDDDDDRSDFDDSDAESSDDDVNKSSSSNALNNGQTPLSSSTSMGPNGELLIEMHDADDLVYRPSTVPNLKSARSMFSHLPMSPRGGGNGTSTAAASGDAAAAASRFSFFFGGATPRAPGTAGTPLNKSVGSLMAAPGEFGGTSTIESQREAAASLGLFSPSASQQQQHQQSLTMNLTLKGTPRPPSSPAALQSMFSHTVDRSHAEMTEMQKVHLHCARQNIAVAKGVLQRALVSPRVSFTHRERRNCLPAPFSGLVTNPFHKKKKKKKTKKKRTATKKSATTRKY